MPPITFADVLNAIRNGAHAVDDIAAVLRVHHTSAALRRALHDLTKDGELVRATYEVTGGGPRDGQPAFRFDIPA